MKPSDATPPLHMTPTLWTLAALFALAGLIALWTVVRPAKPKREPKFERRHYAVSSRVLWWRKVAPAAAVRREIAPLEVQLAELAELAAYFNEQADAEEGDHARR